MDMRINYCIYKIPSPVPIVSQMNPIHLNMWSLPFGVSSQKPVWISVVHHVSHTPIYLIIYDFIILKVCVQVYKLWNFCLCNLSNLLFLPLGGSKWLPYHPIHEHPQSMFL